MQIGAAGGHALDGVQQFIGRPVLVDEAVGPGLHGLDHVLEFAAAGEHQHRQAGPGLADARQGRQDAGAGHQHVQQHEVEVIAAGLRDGGVGVAYLDHLQAFVRVLQQLAQAAPRDGCLLYTSG